MYTGLSGTGYFTIFNSNHSVSYSRFTRGYSHKIWLFTQVVGENFSIWYKIYINELYNWHTTEIE